MDYRITTEQTISRDYVVTADTEEQAREIWTNTLIPNDAEQDFYGKEKVMVIDHDFHDHAYELKYDGITRQMDRSCGAYVCLDCGDHENLARCYCGWAKDGGDGVAQLRAMGENVEDDYNY